ncbi:hypothetical protein [Sphingomonas floccifaciens]
MAARLGEGSAEKKKEILFTQRRKGAKMVSPEAAPLRVSGFDQIGSQIV